MSAFVPIEVIIEILCRLPVKTLLRFTSVCKTWYSLILNPSFISKHLNQSILDPDDIIKNKLILVGYHETLAATKCFALDFDNAKYTELEYPFKDCIVALSTCNGLVLLADSFNWTDTMIIWNPCAKISVRLPKPLFPSLTQWDCFLGFGFDFMNNDYKVVRILYDSVIPGVPYFNNSPNVEIYTLSTGVWRNICDIAPSYKICNYRPVPVWFYGHSHWVCIKHRENGSLHKLISGFDMSAEVFREVMIPEMLVETDISKLAILSWDKSLALVQYEYELQNRRHGECCWIWRMNEYNVVESWSRLFKIDMSEGLMTVICLQRTNEVIMYCGERGLIAYHPNTQKIQALGIPATLKVINIYSFVESLVLVEGKQSCTF